MIDLLYIRSAQLSVDGFVTLVNENKILESKNAVDCEALLAAGISAFDAINKVDECIRDAVFSKRIKVDEVKVEEAILRLYQLWMSSVGLAKGWASTCNSVGLEVGNLAQFEECVQEVKSLLAKSNRMSPALHQLELEALEEYRSGKTAEYFSE